MLNEQTLQETLDLAIHKGDTVVETLAFNALMTYRASVSAARIMSEDICGEKEDPGEAQAFFLDMLSGTIMEWIDDHPGYIQRLSEETRQLLPASFLAGYEPPSSAL